MCARTREAIFIKIVKFPFSAIECLNYVDWVFDVRVNSVSACLKRESADSRCAYLRIRWNQTKNYMAPGRASNGCGGGGIQQMSCGGHEMLGSCRAVRRSAVQKPVLVMPYVWMMPHEFHPHAFEGTCDTSTSWDELSQQQPQASTTLITRELMGTQ